MKRGYVIVVGGNPLVFKQGLLKRLLTEGHQVRYINWLNSFTAIEPGEIILANGVSGEFKPRGRYILLSAMEGDIDGTVGMLSRIIEKDQKEKEKWGKKLFCKNS